MESTKLWNEEIPGYIEGASIPTIHYYPAKNKKGDGCVVIFAGGGYRGRAAHEGEGYAHFFEEKGIDSFVVDYRFKPSYFPLPLLDARRAVRYVRAHAEELGIDPARIAVMGSSAGGHMAALVSTYLERLDGEGVDALDEVDFKPNAQILCYPVTDNQSHTSSYPNLMGEGKEDEYEKITPLLLANRDTPPAFIWHTSTDSCVDVNGSLRYAARLHELGISVELHVYPVGGHGLGVGYYPEKNIDVPYVRGWTERLAEWLKLVGWLKG